MFLPVAMSSRLCDPMAAPRPLPNSHRDMILLAVGVACGYTSFSSFELKVNHFNRARRMVVALRRCRHRPGDGAWGAARGRCRLRARRRRRAAAGAVAAAAMASLIGEICWRMSKIRYHNLVNAESSTSQQVEVRYASSPATATWRPG